MTILMSSCMESPIEGDASLNGEMGLLQVALSVDERLEIIPTKSGGLDASLVPAADDFYVELYRFGKRSDKAAKETWNRLYFGTYAEAKEMTMRVNGGDWKLLAFHGDSTACGFEKPYFKAEKSFVVDGGLNADGEPNITRVQAEAIVSNVWISVNFDETIPGSFYDYFVRLTNLDDTKNKQILRYKKGETRPAFMMPTKNLQVEFMAQYEYGDENSWRFVNLGTIEANPNDHLNINLSVNPRHGNLDVNITTDNTVVKETTEFEILEMWTPQDAPQIVAAGFTNGDHAVVEGDVTGNNATVSVLARGGLKNFFLKVDSDYLNTIGLDIPLGEEIDLANPTSGTQAKLDKLAAAGLSWQDDMAGSRKLTYLTMTGLFAKINAANSSLTVSRKLATFTIRVVDQVNKETVTELTATALPIVQHLEIPEGNVWATSIVSPKLTVERGMTSLFNLQMSTDGVIWENVARFVSADKSVINFETIPTEPSKTYNFRTIYNNNPDLVSNVVTVTTEQPLQVGNAGFEEYQTVTMHVTPMGAGILSSAYDREWYLPYKSGETDPWWAVNSKQTMPQSPTGWTETFCKNFPCTAYSTIRYAGEKSALVYTINVGNTNTASSASGTSVAGEIWIGKADDDGNHVDGQDGHAFTSRPKSVKFWYRYNPINNETFAFKLWIKDASGKEIAQLEKIDLGEATEWTLCEIPIVYSYSDLKAARIYMSFKSSTSPGVNAGVSMEIAGQERTAHIGSALRIDNIELIY